MAEFTLFDEGWYYRRWCIHKLFIVLIHDIFYEVMQLAECVGNCIGKVDFIVLLLESVLE